MLLRADQFGYEGIQDFPAIYKTLESGLILVIKLSCGRVIQVGVNDGKIKIGFYKSPTRCGKKIVPISINDNEIGVVAQILKVCDVILEIDRRGTARTIQPISDWL